MPTAIPASTIPRAMPTGVPAASPAPRKTPAPIVPRSVIPAVSRIIPRIIIPRIIEWIVTIPSPVHVEIPSPISIIRVISIVDNIYVDVIITGYPYAIFRFMEFYYTVCILIIHVFFRVIFSRKCIIVYIHISPAVVSIDIYVYISFGIHIHVAIASGIVYINIHPCITIGRGHFFISSGFFRCFSLLFIGRG